MLTNGITLFQYQSFRKSWFLHALTAFGLEAQATAYSYGRNEEIKYLGILSQINQPVRGTSEDDGPTELDIFDVLKREDPSTNSGRYFGCF